MYRVALLITALTVALFAIRITGPSDLMDKDQERPAAYVLDAVRNGNWICQRDWLGAVTSKPPLYTWLAALASLPTGRVSLVTLMLPAALATLGASLLVLGVGWTFFDRRAGLLAALTYLLSFVAMKQVALARTDGLFSFTVALVAMLAFRAWSTGRWTWFWLAAAAATLTKGPLGVVLGAAGLTARWWEARSGATLRLRGNHVAGVVLFLVITAGWFGLAYRQVGHELVDQMLGSELVGHVVGDNKGAGPLANCYKPLLYFLARFAPWSVVACVGLVRVVRRPAAAEPERRLERFLFCWCVVGLLLFSVGAHQRGDLIFPLVPAAALLAGRELARWVRPVGARAFGCGVVVVMAGGLGIDWHNCHVQARQETCTQQTEGMRVLADQIRQQAGESLPLTHVDDPFALQFFLNTMQTAVPVERAAKLLQGDAPAFVAVRNLPALKNQMAGDDSRLQVLARWPSTGEAFVTVVGNRLSR